MRYVKWLVIFSLIVGNAGTVFGHGVRVDYAIDTASGSITVQAVFDTGEPLEEGQVIIFAPNDLVNPWRVDVLDAEGVFTFTPDYDLVGFWDVQVRKAGHGGLIHIEITAEMKPDETNITPPAVEPTIITLSDSSTIMIEGNAEFQVNGDIVISASGHITQPDSGISGQATLGSGFTPLQIIIMAISVIWGFIGTAFFFARRKS
jgi:nickel transport protein